jgi:hypothetical protein
VWLTSVSQSDFNARTYIYKSVNSKLNKKNHTDTHTHTNCWYTVHYLWANILTSIYWITMLNRPEVTEPQESLMYTITSQNPNERFSFKDSYAYLNSGYTQRVWNSGYSKYFYKDQRNQFSMTLWVLNTLICKCKHTHIHTHKHSCPRSMRRDKCNSWNAGIPRMRRHFHISK